MYSKVISIDQYGIHFDTGHILTSLHEQDCCESHYLSFTHLTDDDFKGLAFDLSGDSFFKKIEGYGIELVPVEGWSVKIPGYGSNNGWYSTELELVLVNGKSRKSFDITTCQEISD